MSKIKLKLSLKTSNNSYNKEINGIFNDNRIVYNDDGIKTTISLDNLSIERENVDYKLELIFSEKPVGKYLLKKFNKIIDLDLKPQEFKINDNKITIKYYINFEEYELFEYKIEYNIIK